jgi:hypothetical protein
MTKRKRTKGQTTIYKTLHIKLKIVAGAPEGLSVLASLVAPVVLF